jgi:hypothetical protein
LNYELLLRRIARTVRRDLGLSPMQSIMRELVERGVMLRELRVLEVFSFTGEMRSKDYASKVSSLEAWEINPAHEILLRRNLPKADVRITDSYEEIRRTPKKYNCIIVDNSPYHGTHCEHFDLFPDVFRVAMDQSILIILIIPELNRALFKSYPEMWEDYPLASRKTFYGTDHPEAISIERMVEVYKNQIAANQFSVEWYFVQKRNQMIYDLVVKIKRESSSLTSPHVLDPALTSRL